MLKNTGAESMGGGAVKPVWRSAVMKKRKMARFQIGQIQSAYHAHRSPGLNAYSVIAMLRIESTIMVKP